MYGWTVEVSPDTGQDLRAEWVSVPWVVTGPGPGTVRERRMPVAEPPADWSLSTPWSLRSDFKHKDFPLSLTSPRVESGLTLLVIVLRSLPPVFPSSLESFGLWLVFRQILPQSQGLSRSPCGKPGPSFTSRHGSDSGGPTSVLRGVRVDHGTLYGGDGSESRDSGHCETAVTGL